MSMKSKGMLMAMMAMACMGESMMYGSEERRTRPQDMSSSSKIKPIPAGCKEFVFESQFGEFKTIALDENRAAKKFTKWLNKQNNG